jgi:predicted Zn-dependent protease
MGEGCDPPKSPFSRGTLILVPPFSRGARGDHNPRNHRSPRYRNWLRSLIFALCLYLGIVWPGQSLDLPDFQTYPLPDRLTTLKSNNAGDYFDRLDKPPVGALIWTKLPIQVFLDLANSKVLREEAWLAATRQAIADWAVYLPIVETTDPKLADITIRRASVPIQRDKNGKLKPIRFAETRFEFYTQDQRLWHRMTINLSPNQADQSLLAGARHELGHALGIWGHSDRNTDTMYFSQVAHPTNLSPRDINTLKRVYATPSRLGSTFPQ